MDELFNFEGFGEDDAPEDESNETDAQEDFDDAVAAKVLAKALSFILEDTEGIYVVVEDKAYVVYRDGAMIRVDEGEEKSMFGESLVDGTMLWVHDKDDDPPCGLN